ncbi:hypothetical protein FRAAL2419 [Frankia alni ACN14a]|uniref:Uncharacterized protein n=1 Tax=Frankia alni (strain DSM 45986 / CECT 9034 / ACN14a) TaxID=326424 RepID=Q0RN25_FRAAA|nr:hypothetical protein FRAAL2419 [Frankia alni ACN14a]
MPRNPPKDNRVTGVIPPRPGNFFERASRAPGGTL